jgi:predicted MPP superfamily phosphohydrolase
MRVGRWVFARWAAAVPPLDDADTELFWFLHVSDVHLSAFTPSRKAHLTTFVTETVPVVSPTLVVATGDLTDGLEEDTVFRRPTSQQLQEWQDYQAVLANAGLNDTARWLDLRGNHDGYGVPQGSSQVSCFRVHVGAREMERGRVRECGWVAR